MALHQNIKEDKMKKIRTLCLLLLVVASLCGCATSRLTMENIGKNYGMLSYDHGALIPMVPDETRTDMMKQYCKPRNYQIIETDKKTVGQYHFRTKILFQCIERE